jgi:hypothetical protein
MNRLEKCELLKSKGYAYDPETGKIFGIYGKEYKSCDENGYINIEGNKNFQGSVKGHHFAWYMTYGNVDFIELDHKDTNPNNNKIDNLRIADRLLQNRNRNSKGYTWDSKRNKWLVRIFINRKPIYIGRFDTEEEARTAYLKSKEKYWDKY